MKPVFSIRSRIKTSKDKILKGKKVKLLMKKRSKLYLESEVEGRKVKYPISLSNIWSLFLTIEVWESEG